MINKKMLGVVAIGMSTLAINTYALTQGAYLGGQLGYGNTHMQDEKNSALKFDANHLAGHIFAGYAFNPYVALELGGAKYGSVTAKLRPEFISPNHPNVEKLTLKTNVVDLVAKGSYPINEEVSLFGKVGAAYVLQDIYVDNEKHSAAREKKLLPTASIGVAYALSENVTADVSYTRIQKVGDTQVKSLDFAGLGLTYNFG